MLRALIFDVDGTLAETEEAHRLAFNDTFAAFGLDWHWSRDLYRDLLKTTGGKERMCLYAQRHLGIDPGSVPVADIHAAKTARYGEMILAGAAPLRPGIANLLADAADKGMRLAVATTTNLPNVEALMQGTLGLAASDVFEVIAAGDMVAAKKPAPDVYLLALNGLGLPAAECLAFEDSANGLKSAQAAGLACLVCPSWYTRADDFTGAAAIVDSYQAVAGMAALDAMFVSA
ncbi:MAG: HAD-IA family hydrolase [Rhodobacteraceae bacterium]|nr:HAD-IA family hydrolase [Paracoccaceae bacterium]